MKKLLLVVFVLSYLLDGYSQSETYKEGSKCFVMSQDFVKNNLNYPLESKFSHQYVHETNGLKQCIIIGQVIAKNGFGIRTQYTYKIWMSHNGGEWNDIKNWNYTKLILEDEQGKQKIIDKEQKKETVKQQVKELGSVDGIKCTFVEANEYYTRIVTSKRLTRAQILKAGKILKIKTDIIYFHLSGKTERAAEYGSIVGEYISIF